MRQTQIVAVHLLAIALILAPLDALGQGQLIDRLEDQHYQPFLNRTLAALRHDDIGQAAVLFRYFEESLPAASVARDKAAVRIWLNLLRNTFGRAQAAQALRETAVDSVFVSMESAERDAWNNSACLFKTYAIRTHFSDGHERRNAEAFPNICYDVALRTTWLRSITVRFPNNDATTRNKAQELLRRFLEATKQGAASSK